MIPYEVLRITGSLPHGLRVQDQQHPWPGQLGNGVSKLLARHRSVDHVAHITAVTFVPTAPAELWRHDMRRRADGNAPVVLNTQQARRSDCALPSRTTRVHTTTARGCTTRAAQLPRDLRNCAVLCTSGPRARCAPTAGHVGMSRRLDVHPCSGLVVQPGDRTVDVICRSPGPGDASASTKWPASTRRATFRQ